MKSHKVAHESHNASEAPARHLAALEKLAHMKSQKVAHESHNASEAPAQGQEGQSRQGR
jgi:hypothetical protein